MMRVIIGIVFGSISFSSLGEINATCIFDNFTVVYASSSNEPASVKIAQTLTMKGGTTSNETLALDGKYRATNSKTWSFVENVAMYSSKSHFIGDAGELLTIFHEVGESALKLSGNFKASLLDSGYNMSGVRYGSCSIKN